MLIRWKQAVLALTTDGPETRDVHHATDDEDPTTTDTKMRKITARKKSHSEGAAEGRINRRTWTNTTTPLPHTFPRIRELRRVQGSKRGCTYAFQGVLFFFTFFPFSVFLYPISHENTAKALGHEEMETVFALPSSEDACQGGCFLDCKDVYSKRRHN